MTVRGFVLRNVGTSFVEDRAAIKAEHVHGCSIDHNRVENGFFGIYLADVTDCRISANVIRGVATRETEAGNGIHLWRARRVTIEDNYVSGQRDGIYFEFVHDTDVRHNVSTQNLRYGLHFMYSDGCRYTGEHVPPQWVRRRRHVHEERRDDRQSVRGQLGAGRVRPAAQGDQRPASRRKCVRPQHHGPRRRRRQSHRRQRQPVSEQRLGIRLEASTVDGRFTRNNFIGNTFDVATNSRSPSAVFVGNFWDDYRGYDLDRDGNGDVPHRPVRLFSVVVERHPAALILLRSTFATLLDAAERVLPSLTPDALVDSTPAMKRLSLTSR